MGAKVAITCNGRTEVHASGLECGGDYVALCGLAGNDPPEQVTVALPPGAKIDCDQCMQLWEAWLQYGAGDFAMRSRKARKGAR